MFSREFYKTSVSFFWGLSQISHFLKYSYLSLSNLQVLISEAFSCMNFMLQVQQPSTLVNIL